LIVKLVSDRRYNLNGEITLGVLRGEEYFCEERFGEETMLALMASFSSILYHINYV
jgi:hypothetical protein